MSEINFTEINFTEIKFASEDKGQEGQTGSLGRAGGVFSCASFKKMDFCIFLSLSFRFTFPCVILGNDLENAYGIYLRFCKFNGSFRLVRKHFL